MGWGGNQGDGRWWIEGKGADGEASDWDTADRGCLCVGESPGGWFGEGLRKA